MSDGSDHVLGVGWELPSRWAVALQGDPIDLEQAAYLFAHNTEVCIRSGIVPASPSATVLIAKEFDVPSTPRGVHDAAQRIVDFLNGILFVDDPARQPISTGGVHERRPDGKWNIAIICASGHVVLRGVSARGSVAGQPLPPPRQTLWMAAGLQDDTVADVLTYLRDKPDWFDLYKACEAMTRDVGRNNPKGPKWPSDIGAFSRDAQLHRHSREWCERKGIKADGSMTLEDARSLIRSMAQAWLEWKCA